MNYLFSSRVTTTTFSNIKKYLLKSNNLNLNFNLRKMSGKPENPNLIFRQVK
jgi:hypothetical protein